MIDLIGEAQSVALLGLLGGIVLGLAARIGRFCTLGAIEDVLYGGDDKRLRMWGVAIGAAIITAHLAMVSGLVPQDQISYLNRGLNPISVILGGLIFGYGMAMAGNCGYGALARLGGGDLRSLVIVVVMGIAAYVMMSGPLASMRLALFPVEPSSADHESVSQLLAQLASASQLMMGALIGLGFIALALSSSAMRRSPSHIFWGLMVGLSVTFGWLATAYIARNGFAPIPLQSFTFAAPLGEATLYLMTASGRELSFGVGSIAGVLIGALLGSFSKGHFRWEACDDPRELRRQIGGAVLMGFGAILAFGCSIGQGISAFSVLAVSAPLALVSIFVGAAIGLKQLITGFAPIDG